MPDPEYSATGRNQRYYGKYRGTVSSNDDPKVIGRLKAKVPDVLGDLETGWALPCLPFAGNGMGQFTVPSPGAGVWIEFEAGDVSRPVWTGGWWGSDEVPKTESGTTAKPPIKIIQSESGLMLVLDDGAKVITLSDANGKNMMQIKTTEGKIKILSATKVIVEAPQIELVENAPHPVVFGDQLLQYLNQLVNMFNAHLHPGQMGMIPITPAPPVPNFPPATSALLSNKVKSG